MISGFVAGRNKALDSGQKQEIGIGGFYMFARVADSASYTAQIPTYTLEDGSVASDQIILDPLELTITGEVSDVHVRGANAAVLPGALGENVGAITVLLPNRTQGQLSRIRAFTQDIYDKYQVIDRKVKSTQDIFQSFNEKNQTKGLREQFVDFIESVYYGRQLISVDMPFRSHENMGITGLTLSTDNQTNAIGFEITLKRVTFVELLYSDISQFYKAPAPSVKAKTDSMASKGAQNPADASAPNSTKKQTSLLGALLGR